MTIKELKDKNVRVKIVHYRPFLTKIQRTKKDNITIYLPRYFKRNKDFILQSRGGYCTIACFDANGLVGESISICHANDNYDYKQAVNKALEKLTVNI